MRHFVYQKLLLFISFVKFLVTIPSKSFSKFRPKFCAEIAESAWAWICV